MHYSKLFSILVTLAISSWVVADDPLGPCTDAPGVVNGQCVRVFDAADCETGNQISEFKPNVCDGSCLNIFAQDGSVESFDAVSWVGDGLFGTDCKIFSDQDCQTELIDTGNRVPAPPACKNFPTAQSIQCFFKC